MVLPFRETWFLMIFVILSSLVLALIFNEFWHRFWLHFGIPLASNFMFLGDRFFDDFLNRFYDFIFFDFCSKSIPKQGPIFKRGWGIWPPKTVPKSIPVANSIFYWFCIDLGLHFDAFFMTFDTFVGTCFRSWCWFAVPRRFQNPIPSIGFYHYYDLARSNGHSIPCLIISTIGRNDVYGALFCLLHALKINVGGVGRTFSSTPRLRRPPYNNLWRQRHTTTNQRTWIRRLATAATPPRRATTFNQPRRSATLTWRLDRRVEVRTMPEI